MIVTCLKLPPFLFSASFLSIRFPFWASYTVLVKYHLYKLANCHGFRYNHLHKLANCHGFRYKISNLLVLSKPYFFSG